MGDQADRIIEDGEISIALGDRPEPDLLRASTDDLFESVRHGDGGAELLAAEEIQRRMVVAGWARLEEAAIALADLSEDMPTDPDMEVLGEATEAIERAVQRLRESWDDDR